VFVIFGKFYRRMRISNCFKRRVKKLDNQSESEVRKRQTLCNDTYRENLVRRKKACQSSRKLEILIPAYVRFQNASFPMHQNETSSFRPYSSLRKVCR